MYRLHNRIQEVQRYETYKEHGIQTNRGKPGTYVIHSEDGRIYEGITTAVLNNLRKHYKKGVYSTDKAVDAWYQVATEGSRSYNKEFGYSFSVGDRFTVAVELEKYYREDVEEA